MKPVEGNFVVAGAAIVVVAAVLAGLLVLGSPVAERERRLDERRISDLQGLKTATDVYWTRHARLPASLQELGSEPGLRMNTTDPVTSVEYVYEPVDSLRYRMCARFDRASIDLSDEPADHLWAHGSGEHCFTLPVEDLDDPGR